MSTDTRKAITSVVRKYRLELRIIDASSQKASEEAKCLGANAKSSAAKRYYEAKQYTDQITPAWAKLDAVDQHILEEFYGQRMRRTGATDRLIDEYGISARQLYYLSARARQRFADALAALTTTKEKGADDDEETNS